MRAAVTGAFITPLGADPSKKVVQPPRDAEGKIDRSQPPVIVNVPSWCFEHHAEHGNLEAVEAWEARQESLVEQRRQDEELDSLSDEMRRRALGAARREALKEEIDSLEELDKGQLADVARRRKLYDVGLVGNDKAVRGRVKRALEVQLADMAPPSASPRQTEPSEA